MTRLVALVLILLATLSQPAHAQEAEPRVVVVGVPGLLWQHIGPATPTLARLAREGAVGALSVKSPEAVTCPADGWLTLGAGARTTSFSVPRQPCTAELPAVSDDDRRRNLDATDEAEVGALARALGGLEVEGPGAALAGGPGTDGRVRLVDGGAVDARGGEGQLAALDARLSTVLAALPAGADVLVVGLSEAAGATDARLHVAIGHGPSFDHASLRSSSTRRDGYVQLIDVAPTVLQLLGEPVPEEMDGGAWSTSGTARSPAQLADLDVRAVEGKRVTVWFFVLLIAVQVLLVIGLRHRPRAVRCVTVGGIAALGASYAAMLVPWWRADQPFAVLVLVVLLLTAAVTAVALRTRHPVAVACGATALLLVGDLLTGAHLQIESPAGYSSLVAGRFAGIGNVAFGIYGTCLLLTAAAVAGGRSRRDVLLILVPLGVVAVAVDGAPPWGSDVGGVLALLPAFALLGMLLTGTRVSVLRLLLAGAVAALLVTVFALVDYARPAADRTHLGRFVGQVRDGSAGEVVGRKAAAIGHLLFGNPVTALLPLVMVGVVVLFLRPPPPLAAAFEAEPSFRQALLAAGLMALLGFALNDSGPAVVALAVLVALPATLAVTAGVAAGRDGARST